MRKIAFALAVAALPFSSCSCDPPAQVTGDVCGTGSVDGQPFGIDADKTRAVIVVERADGAGCGVFHNHVVQAKAAKLEYSVNTQDVGSSTFKMTVLASSLDPDADDLRDEFLTKHDPPLDGQPLSSGDRESIKGSVADEVLAGDNPQLVFTFSNMSSANGEGTVDIKAELAGAESTVQGTYKIEKDGDNFVIKDATAILDGAPYGIPRNSLGFCVKKDMELHFDLVLTPADATPVCDLGGGGGGFEKKVFGDDACAENIGFNEARDVVVKRCAGCHAAEQRLGATVPLVTWEDWRTNSLRNPTQPAYLTASGYIHLPEDQSLSMPPQDAQEILATDLSDDEIAVADAWFNDGARDAACAGDPGPKLFPHATAVACSDDANYDSVDANPSAQGQTARTFFENNCGYCHLDSQSLYLGVPQISQVDADGAVQVDPANDFYGLIDDDLAHAPVFHGYYQGDDGTNLNFWEASVLRFVDNSMPPGGLGIDPTNACTTDADCGDGFCYVDGGVCVGDPSFIAFADWVKAGYASEACTP